VNLEQLVARLEDQLARTPDVHHERSPSRWAGSAAHPDHVQAVAKAVDYRTAPDPRRSHRGNIAATLTKALAEGTGSAGGYLVPEEIAGEVLTLLRARSAVMRLGPRIVPVKKELRIVSLTEGATADYVEENEPISVSEQTFAQAPLLRPKQLAALVPVSNRLLRDATQNPDADQVIREDLAEVLAMRADLAFLRGTGTDPEPRGIRNVAGLTPGPDLGNNGATPTFDDLKDTVANLRAIDGPFRRPGWIFNPRLLSTLEKVKDSAGRYLADAGLLTFDPTGGGGTLLGYPFVTTTQIPIGLTVGTSDDTTELYFSSDWQECWIGDNQQLTIEVSAEASYTTDGGTTWRSAFQSDQTLFRAKTTHDLGLRRPHLFTVVAGVRP
jgi:HK97 family phage major capsid protein